MVAVSVTALVTLVTLMASVADGWVFAAPVLIVAALMARAAWDAIVKVAPTDPAGIEAARLLKEHPDTTG